MRSEMPSSAMPLVRIVVVDQHELFRAGLRVLLTKQPGFEVVGEAAALPEALVLVKREQPDITLLGVEPDDGQNLDVLPELCSLAEAMSVLVLTGSNDPELHRRAVCLGAIGVLSKDKPAEVLVKAIEKIHAGEAWLDRSMTASVLREMSPRNRARKQDPEEMKIASLTGREREVITLVGEGLKNKQIAERLFISDITVHHHLTSIYSKLEVADRLELLIYAYRNGLAALPR
ncbi:MAG TPA: response regulator transcription factor [Acidobacteriota bacterium]|nr:response regulator transcription factor [Acidobacteriota bacterium]